MSPSRKYSSVSEKQLHQNLNVIGGLIAIIVLFAFTTVIPTLIINFILFWNYA